MDKSYVPPDNNESQTSESKFKDARDNRIGSVASQSNKNPSVSLNTNVNIISLLEQELSTIRKIPNSEIKHLLKKIYPIEESHTNDFISLYRSILRYITMMIDKQDKNQTYCGMYAQKYDENSHYNALVKEICRFANSRSSILAEGVKMVLDRSDVRSKILRTVKKSSNNNEVEIISQKNRKQPIDLLSSISLKNKFPVQSIPKLTQSKPSYDFNTNFQPDPSKTKTELSYREQKNSKNLINDLKIRKNQKNCLLCSKELKAEAYKLQKIFECEQCGRKMHYSCNPRKYNCVFCQLRCMCPLSEVQEELFVGVLPKNTKRHEIFFNYSHDPKQQLLTAFIANGFNNRNETIELRSLRIKQNFDSNASYILLFPDACTLTLNRHLIKEILPIHKLSSLKYRQDQSITLSKNFLKTGVNNLSIIQRFLKKDLKEDERVEPQNHLIGIYLIKNTIKPKQLAENCQVLAFQESQAILKQSLLIKPEDITTLDRNGRQIEPDIACQTQKISLMCSLTLQKLVYPGRTIFCTHIHCFDILNFVVLNSQSKIPKWQCPICKAPAYSFKIDPIVKAIVKLSNDKTLYKKKDSHEEWSEVIFTREMKFKIVDKNEVEGPEMSIYELEVGNKSKKNNHPLGKINKENYVEKIESDLLIDLSSNEQFQQKMEKASSKKQEKGNKVEQDHKSCQISSELQRYSQQKQENESSKNQFIEIQEKKQGKITQNQVDNEPNYSKSASNYSQEQLQHFAEYANNQLSQKNQFEEHILEMAKIAQNLNTPHKKEQKMQSAQQKQQQEQEQSLIDDLIAEKQKQFENKRKQSVNSCFQNNEAAIKTKNQKFLNQKNLSQLQSQFVPTNRKNRRNRNGPGMRLSDGKYQQESVKDWKKNQESREKFDVPQNCDIVELSD